MFAIRATTPLEAELTSLAEALDGLDMRAAALLAPDLVTERDRLARVIRHYLIPRLTDPARAMTVVVAGPTGSGKSTIVNSLTGIDLAETGALRPTTRTPLVITTSEQAGRFQELGGVRCHVAVSRTPILSRMALVDTPDIDSSSVEHREMAEQLIDGADVVVFVTSAMRYADRVPWEVLRRAVDRGAPLITVLNRLAPSSTGAVSDYQARLARAGIEGDVVRIPEQRGGPGLGHVPMLVVKDLSARLRALADDMDGGRRAGMTVAENLLDDASGLADSLSGLARLLDGLVAEADVVVSRGMGRLGFQAVVEGMALPGRRSWLRRLLRLPHRVSASHMATWLQTLVSRLSAEVESELRATMIELEELIPSAPGNLMIEPALVTSATAIHGWMAHLRRTTEGMGRRRHMGMAVLALGALEAPADDRVASALHAEARADLERRLSVAFSQLAMVATARLRAISEVSPDIGIAEMVTRARARLTFADA